MVKLTGLNKIKTAVFISGSGSNLKNLIKFSKMKNSPLSIDLIFSNTSKAKGLRFSSQFNIKKYILGFKDPKASETKILDLLKKRMEMGVRKYGHGVRVDQNTQDFGTEDDDWELMALEEMLDGLIYTTAQIIR